MSELNDTDRILLSRVLGRIEQQAGLSGSTDLSQKDFDFLLFYIEEKTGHALSLTTIKRIWRNEYQRLPHLSTLNMLAQIAYDLDWHTCKRKFLEEQSVPSTENKAIAKEQRFASPQSTHVSRWPVRILASLAALALLTFFGFYFANAPLGNTKNVAFSASVTADLVVPNSVVFSYDVRGINADHFYIQQSWDEAKKVEVSPANRKLTDIYYEPGYHYAKLIGNNEVLKEIAVHIRYNDWFVRFRYPDSRLVRVPESGIDSLGHLGVKPGYLEQDPPGEQFQLGYMLSKDFNLMADDLRIDASVKFDSAYAPPCPTVHLLIKGDKEYAWISLGNKGCESNLGLHVSDLRVSGKTNDLSLLGMDAFSWQQVRADLAGGVFKLFLNGKLVYEGSYSGKLGVLKEVDLFFNGIGSIDEINLADHDDHSLLSQSF